MIIIDFLFYIINSFIRNPLFYILLLLLILLIYYLFMYYISIDKERRISKYSIEALKDETPSFFDIVNVLFLTIREKITKVLKKSDFFTRYARRYNKYITYENEKEMCAMDYISNKFLLALLFIFLTVVTNTIVPNMFGVLQTILFGIIGFFVIDIYFIIYNKIKKKQIEQDLLNAIIIMNNAFRSGNSTIQAIEIVSKELKGSISQEFKKMYLEISYGLSLDVVFDRFSKRVDSKEVSYITSSLSILNKTGGNIIKVFASIEKMLFNKRKLKEEMKSLTSSSKMVSIFLLILPLTFIIFIIILNPLYFIPLINTTIGNILLIITIILYSLYIFTIIKIMNVRYN